jgi:uncharacterized protein (DUF427 family)
MTFLMKHEPGHETQASPRSESAARAVWRGRTIAESDRTREVDGYRYFPRDAVRMELLHASPRTADDLECPHGVQFYDVGEGASRSPRAAWSYEAPGARMQPVDHWIGFWEDVEVVPPSGDGG